MLSIEPMLNHVVPLMLVIFRLAGLFIFSPMLAGLGVTRQIKVLLAVSLGLSVYVSAPTAVQTMPSADLISLVPMIAGELLIGVVVGLIALVPLVSLNLAGMILGQQMGLGVARVFNPAAGSDSSIIGQLLFFLGLWGFIAMGGFEWLFISVADTFARVPVGSVLMTDAPLDLLVAVVTSGFDLALRVAAPVLSAVLLETLATGFVMKTMPQLNILSVGFPIKIALGLIVLGSSLLAISQAADDEMAQVLRAVGDWTSSLGTQAGGVNDG